MSESSVVLPPIIIQNAPAIQVPEVVLNSRSGSRKMPVIGMGTAVEGKNYDATAIKIAMLEAIGLGYRHFDTATSYSTEKPIGEAIAEALKLRLIGSRDELFITSKLWLTDSHPDRVIPALNKSLQNLQLGYLDLYLIHWPISTKPGVPTFPVKQEDLLPMDFKSVWAAMEDCQRLGLTKSIGVCNFSCKKLENLLKHAAIPPSINQVEMSPVWQQQKLREFCAANGIFVIAYAPLGAKGTHWGTSQVMDCEVLQEIAKEKGKTVAQVSLRWVYEQGVAFLVKSFNKERMKENISIFDWALSRDDYEKINKIQQQRGMPKRLFASDSGPYKTLEELWDGEI